MTDNSVGFRRPLDQSYGSEYGPLPPEHEPGMYYWPSRGPWPVYHRVEEARGLYPWTGPYGLTSFPLQPYSPFRTLAVGESVNPRLASDTGPEDPGLTEAEFNKAMEQLKTETYKPPNPPKKRRGIFRSRSAKTDKEAQNREDEGKQCSICLEAFVPGEQVVVTPCSHMFHKECITPWVKGHGTCPVCRFALCDGRNNTNNNNNYNNGAQDSEMAQDLLALMRAMEAALTWGHSL